jgi:DNA-binding response OmpR family regulator
MAKILLIEDDLVTAQMVRDWLENERYTVEEAHNGEEALDFIKTYEYDVLIVDWMLPQSSGVEVIKNYRLSGGRAPVLLLTGKRSVMEKEFGLDSGADDYLTKPFDMRELSARIRALLRRSPQVRSAVLRCGNIALDTATCTVSRDGTDIKLLPTEYSLLEFFMRNQGVVFNSASLLEHVWKSDSEATDVAVRTYITRLRKKIDTDGKPSLITTVHGLGYKLESGN